MLVRFKEDEVISPNSTQHFWEPLVNDGEQPYWNTSLFINDTIGLRTLNEKGRIKFVSVNTGHSDGLEKVITEHVIPFLF